MKASFKMKSDYRLIQHKSAKDCHVFTLYGSHIQRTSTYFIKYICLTASKCKLHRMAATQCIYTCRKKGDFGSGRVVGAKHLIF